MGYQDGSAESAESLPGIICVMGPTASGKTQFALDLYEHLPCEIISVDSALVYRGMDIGTAKPEPEILEKIPHRLIDIRDPSEPYSAAEFCADAMSAIEDIHQAGKIPLLVGGTMLYFKFLLEGAAELPSANENVRAEIDALAKQNGWEWVHKQLEGVDPVSASRIHPNDPQRLQRAYEVYLTTGKTLTAFWEEQKGNGGQQSSSAHSFPYPVVQFAMAPTERAVLHQRIEQRFHQMLEQGFVDEVRSLYERGDLHLGLPSIRAVGYRQVWEHFDGLLGFDEMVERGIIATRQLAKRQHTWLRSWQNLTWLTSDNNNLFEIALKKLEASSILTK